MQKWTKGFIALFALLLLQACERRQLPNAVSREEQLKQQAFDAKYEEQMNRMDTQLDTTDAHQLRFEKILQRWEEQTDRMEAILNTIAKLNTQDPALHGK